MGSEFGADFDATVTALAEEYVTALADAGKSWDEARIMASYSVEGNGTLQCPCRLSGELSGILVTAEMRPLVAQVRDSISMHVGKPVMRWRLHIEHGHEPTVDYMLDELRQAPRWWWPDEDEYDGPVYPTTPRPLDTRDGYDYVPVPDGAVISAGDALRRIHAWFGGNVVFFADAFYPPASAERIAETEERLGVVFPQSVRDAYMVFDGHSLDEWVLVSISGFR